MAPPRQSRRELRDQEKIRDRLLGITSGAGRTRPSKHKPSADGVPDIYHEMLSEASAASAHSTEDDRPLKRRKVTTSLGQRPTTTSPRPHRERGNWPSSDINSDIDTGQKVTAQLQTITDSEGSDEDGLDWEQIGLDASIPAQPGRRRDEDDIQDVSIDVGEKSTPKKATPVRRKPATTAEKLVRVAAHEAHVLFLLFHAHVCNSWCNTKQIETRLRTILSARVITLLNPRLDWPQLRISDSFLDGMKLAVDLWRVKFKVTASGMRKSHWADDQDEVEKQIRQIQQEISPFDKAEYMHAAATLKGSQDTGNQLFCSLLRAVGVEARLVCSLQPLPLTTAGQKVATPQKQKPKVYADIDSEQGGATSAEDGSLKGSASDNSASKVKVIAPRQRRRIGQPSLGMPVGTYQQAPTPVKKAPVRKLVYPVFWVEAFNPAYQKWVPVDPTVTGTVGRPSKLEPPASYDQNVLSYVVAFEEDGIARDVTKRYARAFNAKTRKLRIESTEGGARWWKRAMKPFKRSITLDRDQIEDAELAKKEAQEGLPNNIQDFRGHPYYALERHLKRNEIVWPKRPVGKVSAGKSSSSALEPVYRRGDVQIVRSADKWYRFGREIKPGEQPLKHVPARSRRGQSSHADGLDSDEDDPATTALYTFSQTSLYVAPSIVRGRVPRNAFGNLDVYVPSMVPPGGSHVRHQAAAKAARLIGVDYADAVTGFQFKGRQGTAVISGIIVAEEYRDAVYSVIDGFEYEQENEAARARSLESLRLWKRFLTGLRIGERLGLNSAGSNDHKVKAVKEQMDEAEDEEEQVVEAGGFFPDEGANEVAQPPAIGINRYSGNNSEDALVAEERRRPLRRPRAQLPSDNDDNDSDDDSDDESDEYGTDGEEVEEEYLERRAPQRRQRAQRNRDLSAVSEPVQTTRGGKGRALRTRPTRSTGLLSAEQDDEDEEMYDPAASQQNSTGQPTVNGAKSPNSPNANTTYEGDDSIHSRSEEQIAEASLPIVTEAERNADIAEEQDVNNVADTGGGFFPDDGEEEEGDDKHDGKNAMDAGGRVVETGGNVVETGGNVVETGGGFLPDEEEEDEGNKSHRSNADAEADADDIADSGGGFFFASTPEVDAVAAPSRESHDELMLDADVEAARALVGDGKDSKSQSHAVLSSEDVDPGGDDGVVESLDGQVVEEESSDEERGSLLSHDPEDEDAEPEWLEDV